MEVLQEMKKPYNLECLVNKVIITGDRPLLSNGSLTFAIIHLDRPVDHLGQGLLPENTCATRLPEESTHSIVNWQTGHDFAEDEKPLSECIWYFTIGLACHLERTLGVTATSHRDRDAAKQTRMLCRLDSVALRRPGGDELREALDTVTRASRCLHQLWSVLSTSTHSGRK